MGIISQTSKPTSLGNWQSNIQWKAPTLLYSAIPGAVKIKPTSPAQPSHQTRLQHLILGTYKLQGTPCPIAMVAHVDSWLHGDHTKHSFQDESFEQLHRVKNPKCFKEPAKWPYGFWCAMTSLIKLAHLSQYSSLFCFEDPYLCSYN